MTIQVFDGDGSKAGDTPSHRLLARDRVYDVERAVVVRQGDMFRCWLRIRPDDLDLLSMTVEFFRSLVVRNNTTMPNPGLLFRIHDVSICGTVQNSHDEVLVEVAYLNASEYP